MCFLFVTHAVSQIKLACVGNSITQGYNAPSYTEKLKTLLGSKYTVLNAGVSGCTLLKKGNKPYWTQGKLSEVFTFKPDMVTIKLGTNDTKEDNWKYHSTEFTTDYLALIDTLKKLPSNPKIWIVLPCPCWSNQYEIRDSIVKIIIPILKEIASARLIPIIDANTPFINAKSFFSDGVHPNAAGADSLAKVFYSALTANVGVATPETHRFVTGVSLSDQVQTFITIPGTRYRSSNVLSVHNENYFDLRGVKSRSFVGRGQCVLIYDDRF
jgi:lysophospholipase L1-like esterase